jgi:2-amino-4-hydroxy-6-hydroxymethyldihydropteridine diphosphokinase
MTDPQKFSVYSFISIGANLPSAAGSPQETIAFAFQCLEKLSTFPILKSSLYASSPVDSPEGTPDFLNAMAGIISAETETPLSLLHKLQEIENAAGRTRSGIRNEARTLDLDLILFKQQVCHTPELILPHPRANERRFVLEPLIEITEAGFLFPDFDMDLGKMLGVISDDQAIQRL